MTEGINKVKSVKLIISTMFCGSLLLATVPAHAAYKADETHVIQFKKGTSGADIKGTITGDKTKDYTFVAKKGQTLQAVLKSAWPHPFMSIIAPGDQFIFDGMMSGDTYKNTLPASGKYTIRIYQKGAAKDEGKTNVFQLHMKITN